MTHEILLHQCSKGEILPVGTKELKSCGHFKGHIFAGQPRTTEPKLGLRTGNFLCHKDVKLFVVDGFTFISQNLPDTQAPGTDNKLAQKNYFCPMLKALQDIPPSESYESLYVRDDGWSLAVIILSDKGYRGEREDLAGPLIIKSIGTSLNISYAKYYIIPDDVFILKGLLSNLAWLDEMNIIITSGGTGLGKRDITPQVTDQILDYTLPGMEQAMMANSLTKTFNAVLSRAKAGIAGNSLVINLPGSPKAVKENLEAILPALDHGLLKLNGDTRDCGALNE